MSETGDQLGVHRSQKPREIVPEVGTPEDLDEGVSGPQIGVLCSIVPRPRREMMNLNKVSNVKILFFKKLHVHIIIIISALHICYIM